MNLQSLTAGIVGAVNPLTSVTIQKSTGYTTADDGTQVPTYAAPVLVQAQIQALQYNDLTQVSGINIQGQKRAIYLPGDWEGVVRADGSGGDLITLPDGSVWLVALVLENWGDSSGWVKVAVVRQDGDA